MVLAEVRYLTHLLVWLNLGSCKVSLNKMFNGEKEESHIFI